jgi:hypothetical protein
MLRIKGILNLRGRPAPVVIHGVQHIFHPPVELQAWPSGDRRSRSVFITRDIPKETIGESLGAFIEVWQGPEPSGALCSRVSAQDIFLSAVHASLLQTIDAALGFSGGTNRLQRTVLGWCAD